MAASLLTLIVLPARILNRHGSVFRATADPCLGDTLLAFGGESAVTSALARIGSASPRRG